MDRNKAKGMLWGLIVGDTFVKWFADATPDALHRHARPEAPRGEVRCLDAPGDDVHSAQAHPLWQLARKSP